MTVLYRGLALVCIIFMSSMSSALSQGFGILACSTGGAEGPTVVIADFSPSPGALIGKPCAEGLAMARGAGYATIDLQPIALCQGEQCDRSDNGPPPVIAAPTNGNADEPPVVIDECLLFDFRGNQIQASAALVDCDVSAPGGPRINAAQTAGGGPVAEALENAVGQSCSTAVVAALNAGATDPRSTVIPRSGLTELFFESAEPTAFPEPGRSLRKNSLLWIMAK